MCLQRRGETGNNWSHLLQGPPTEETGGIFAHFPLPPVLYFVDQVPPAPTIHTGEVTRAFEERGVGEICIWESSSAGDV